MHLTLGLQRCVCASHPLAQPRRDSCCNCSFNGSPATHALPRTCAQTIMGGGDTVLATLLGVLAFGSRLSPENAVGVVMSVAGTYLCVS